MFWLFRAARRLKQLGIMGMNRRNAAMILDHNPRSKFPLVDDKLRMRDLCEKITVPTPAVYAAVTCYAQLRQLDKILRHRDDFVIKPNNGSGGRGILVVTGRQGPNFLRHNGELLSLDKLRQHMSDVLSGMYSLGGRPDEAIVQQRVRLHPAFEPVSYKGIPDIRVILYRNQPAMAMLRLPTKASNGRANLHQGGIGVGVDLATGITSHAVLRNRFCKLHPDTQVPLVGMQVPYWPEVLTMSRAVAEAVGLGYIGVDIIVDVAQGPMLLEANARPGLAIQMANNRGLVPRLAEIDRLLDTPRVVDGGRWKVARGQWAAVAPAPADSAILARIGPREAPAEQRRSA
jgi:alpha-L-glutamate ligase-like protein